MDGNRDGILRLRFDQCLFAGCPNDRLLDKRLFAFSTDSTTVEYSAMDFPLAS